MKDNQKEMTSTSTSSTSNKISIVAEIENHLKYDSYVDLEEIKRKRDSYMRQQTQFIKQLPKSIQYNIYIDLLEPKMLVPYEKRSEFQQYWQDYWEFYYLMSKDKNDDMTQEEFDNWNSIKKRRPEFLNSKSIFCQK